MEHIPNSNVELYIYKTMNGNTNTDPKYNKEELNYQKKPNIVTMKSNIAKCDHRTKFLLSFLPRLILEGRTILILSCRRAHITDMEEMINKMKINNCSVGLYVGGMKQENLDISATKRVIIATYDMAEEAFDCKSLNTLIYATPHKNIKQAVGRILREEKKKRNFIPLIIDIQDIFSTFNGWNKIREKYYKTEGYPMKIFDVIVKSKTEIPEVKFIKDIISIIKDKGKGKKTNKTNVINCKNKKNSNDIFNNVINNNVIDDIGDGDGDDVIDGDGDGSINDDDNCINNDNNDDNEIEIDF